MSEKINFNYAKKTQTSITLEESIPNNPFVAKTRYSYGYDVIELARKKTFMETLLLLFTGELPDEHKSQLLETLFIGLMNQGPRDSAVRASMTAGVSKTNTAHLLPIGLIVLGGEENGAIAVQDTMKKITTMLEKKSHNSFIPDPTVRDRPDDWHINEIKGFNSLYNEKCPITEKLAETILQLKGVGKHTKFVKSLLKSSNSDDIGWTPVGLASAVFLDIEIGFREGIALFQLICAPGIAAHALEQTHKPLSSMPFLEDSQYELK